MQMAPAGTVTSLPVPPKVPLQLVVPGPSLETSTLTGGVRFALILGFGFTVGFGCR